MDSGNAYDAECTIPKSRQPQKVNLSILLKLDKKPKVSDACGPGAGGACPPPGPCCQTLPCGCVAVYENPCCCFRPPPCCAPLPPCGDYSAEAEQEPPKQKKRRSTRSSKLKILPTTSTPSQTVASSISKSKEVGAVMPAGKKRMDRSSQTLKKSKTCTASRCPSKMSTAPSCKSIRSNKEMVVKGSQTTVKGNEKSPTTKVGENKMRDSQSEKGSQTTVYNAKQYEATSMAGLPTQAPFGRSFKGQPSEMGDQGQDGDESKVKESSELAKEMGGDGGSLQLGMKSEDGDNSMAVQNRDDSTSSDKTIRGTSGRTSQDGDNSSDKAIRDTSEMTSQDGDNSMAVGNRADRTLSNTTIRRTSGMTSQGGDNSMVGSNGDRTSSDKTTGSSGTGGDDSFKSGMATQNGDNSSDGGNRDGTSDKTASGPANTGGDNSFRPGKANQSWGNSMEYGDQDETSSDKATKGSSGAATRESQFSDTTSGSDPQTYADESPPPIPPEVASTLYNNVKSKMELATIPEDEMEDDMPENMEAAPAQGEEGDAEGNGGYIGEDGEAYNEEDEGECPCEDEEEECEEICEATRPSLGYENEVRDIGFCEWGWDSWDRFVSLLNGEPYPNPCMNRCDGGPCDDPLPTMANGDPGNGSYEGGMLLRGDPYSQETYIVLIALPLVLLGLMASFKSCR